MYKEFYGFTAYPFSLTQDPQFLYLSKKHENCLRYLLYSLEQGHELIVLTGKIGTGKTLLLNILMKSLDEKTHKVFLANSKLAFLDILRYVSHAFGVVPPFTRGVIGHKIGLVRGRELRPLVPGHPLSLSSPP
jgi:general secretion pathway protein A